MVLAHKVIEYLVDPDDTDLKVLVPLRKVSKKLHMCIDQYLIIQSDSGCHKNKQFGEEYTLMEYLKNKIMESSDPYSVIVLAPWYLRVGYLGQAMGLAIYNKALSFKYDERIAFRQEANLKKLENRMQLLRIAARKYGIKKAEEDYNLILATRRGDIKQLLQENNIKEARIIIQKLIDIGTTQEDLKIIDSCRMVYNKKKKGNESSILSSVPFKLFQGNSQEEEDLEELLNKLHTQVIIKVGNTGTMHDFEHAIDYYYQKEMPANVSILLTHMEKAAQNGTMEDKRDVLCAYNRLQGYENANKNVKKWQELMENAAQTVEDKRLLAYWYQNGIVLQKDREKAEFFYELAEQQAIDMDSLDVKRALAYSYAKGYLGEVNFSKALDWFTKVALEGSQNDQLTLAFLYSVPQWTRDSWEDNLTLSEYWYEEALSFKRGLPKDYILYLKACEIEKKAEALEQEALKSQLLNFREKAREKKENLKKKAFKKYKESARQGHRDAQYVLALMYMLHPEWTDLFDTHNKEQSLKRNIKILRLLTASGEQGQMFAQQRLGYLYRTRNPIILKDEKSSEYHIKSEMFKWYNMASDQGSPDATFHLGEYYETLGYKEMALYYYKLSASQGKTSANKYYFKLINTRS